MMNLRASLCARFFNLRRCLEIKELQINEEIREREVRLVDDEGNQLGVVATNQAIDLAISKRLDLVKVAPNAKPPVCRLMDYGKYRYDMEKKEKEARKKQKVINIKELRLTPNIEDHDLNTKANRAIDFLKNGDRVKVAVRFRGREMGHTDLGREVLDKFVDLISEYGVVDKKPKMEGRNLVMFLSEKKDNDKSDK
ncbi:MULTISPECIES: translation initiation factor IF-3 [Peptoniphilus]|uniref:translation initiation factor IF-3 n=1 Tax=Peptoniphilus TaxID=162289 RepID=UPI0002EE1BC0|nr:MULTISPECIES: translation initiation factor IF-3 [Peptoniphilus]MDU1043940.1 translation initiation factor IF-3 [Peptoniphilus rhinitidis]MDU1954794.1 translation initiation factor IF-3 [Peptoniphilus lacydonensis]MDU2109205.1 translation initiation factor IF-3 [Peptoniphilus lacydonensis]MDU2115722.1 translation initiation factor IF-3 [Peptoniphilus lacydonensis]MDU3750936.1 translation initiation factor IF-3 [Peptoniphilus rhinitidis]